MCPTTHARALGSLVVEDAAVEVCSGESALSLDSHVPTKGVLDSLCKIGLDSQWFANDDRLDISAEELYFPLMRLFHPYGACLIRCVRQLGLATPHSTT